MKPIILVILGAAMLMPMMYQSNNITVDSDVLSAVKQTERPHLVEARKDSESTMHIINFVTDRLP
ncbi:MAG: hypothetical protein ABI921_13600 [Panacibacter sp.]